MPNLVPLKEYTFFLRGQPIFTANLSELPIYLVIEGQVIILHKGKQLTLIGPGEFLPGTLISASPGLVALAGANCRLVTVDPVVFATLVDFPPAFVLQILQQMTRPSARPAVPRLKWPDSLRAKRLREEAKIFKITTSS